MQQTSSSDQLQALTPELEQKLLDLISDLDKFRREKWFARQLNIFESVGLVRQEIRHSNFLAFLLNPSQNHGLKDTFLKRLIQKVIDKLPGDSPISRLKLALADFSDAQLSREWRNIDVFVESKSNRFVFAIENKVDSSENENQLERYEELVRFEYPTCAHLFCYLTADGEPASRDTWSAVSYSDVIEALQESHQLSSNLPNETRMIIEHYVDAIRRNIVPDQALIDQCRRLYSLHKEALDLIIEHGQVNSFVAAADNFFNNHPDLKRFEVRSARVAFLPAPLLERVPEIEGTNWWGQSRPIVFWFNSYNDRFGIVIEVGPFGNDEFSREVLVKKLLDHFNSRAKIYPKFTRVYSRYQKLTDDQLSDPQELLSRMDSLYKEAADKHLNAIVQIVADFFAKSP
jgi:hypothetical protein